MSRTAEQLIAAARTWIDGDPDAETRAELAAVLESGDLAALEQRLTPLEFGTAGLRGAVGGGSGRMNLAVVTRAAFGIAGYVASLGEVVAGKPIVIGFDARPTSRRFAEASVGVLLAAGLPVVAFPEPCPTPLVAFVGRELGAAVSIVVTASHNPRPDNGYKVYGPDAVRISAPTDALIARHIAAAPAARDIPRTEVELGAGEMSGLTLVGATLSDRYFEAVRRLLPPSDHARNLTIVHSALHGVGSRPMLRALSEAGFDNISVVAAQAEPDGTFPTTPFPNPEEPGTLDLALDEARRRQAQLLLVSDPDADRLAAAARLDGELCVLDGNQLGALLADCLLARAPEDRTPLVLSSVVSSPLVGSMCQQQGARYEPTHTGFKWLWRAALALEAEGQGRFLFGYEEALGYSVFSAVRDKDGIAAGRVLAELAASLAAREKGLFDRLFELYALHGLWASAARNLSVTGPDAALRIARGLDVLTGADGLELAAQRVVRVVDYRDPVQAVLRPSWLGAAALVELELDSGARLFVRPSGTEPKLKLYAHARRDITQRSELRAALDDTRRFAAALLLELEQALHL